MKHCMEEQARTLSCPRGYTLFSATVFVIAALGGVSAALSAPEKAAEVLEAFRKGFSFAEDFTTFQLFVFIFGNNLGKTAIAMVAGVLFGIVPLLMLIVNGYLIGIVGGRILLNEGLLVVLGGLVPHGIFEIPAIIIALSWGIWIGARFSARLFRKGGSITKALRVAVISYVRLVAPLLLAAALVEAFLTPMVLHFIRTTL